MTANGPADHPESVVAELAEGGGPFEVIMARSRHPMVIATVVAAGREPAGCLVGFHTRCSVDPARYLVCLSMQNRTFAIASEAATMAVHHLDAADRAVAQWFGEQTGDEVAKFAGIAWSPGPGGAPVLGDVATWWEGTIVDRVPFGDHTGFVLEPMAGQVGPDRAPFTAAAAAGFEAGHPRD